MGLKFESVVQGTVLAAPRQDVYRSDLYGDDPMTVQVRPITRRESEILDRWQRLDDIVLYRLARILRLSEAKWNCLVIARALVLHVETVRQVIRAFNKGGIPAITPNPRSGGRPPRHIKEVAEAAERLVQQGYSAQEGRASWRVVKAIAVRLNHIDVISHKAVHRLLAVWNVVCRQAVGPLREYNGLAI